MIIFETLLREANLNRSFKCRLACCAVWRVILGLEGQVAIVSNSNTDIVRKQWEGLVQEMSYHYLLDSVKIFGGDLAPNGRKKAKTSRSLSDGYVGSRSSVKNLTVASLRTLMRA